MDDLISRQVAIEIIKNYCENGCDYAEDNWCPSCQRKKFVELLKALPSAQHEPIRLRLDHELSKDEYERLKKDCAEQPIILLPKESAQQWIPCSERLPKKGRYLVTGKKNRDWYTSDKIVTSAFYDGEFWTDNGDIQADAWMPLPEPYKGEEP